MSDYTRTTNFTAKDSLPTGNANKVVKGAEIDTELDNIATAVATKVESGDTVASLTITTATLTTAGITTGNITTANITTANVTTFVGTIDGGTY